MAAMSILNSDFFVTEILPRLPLKSIFRFKCVSKTVKAVISSPEFVKLHLRHQLLCPGSNNLLVLVGTGLIRCYDLDSPPHLPLPLPATATFDWNAPWIRDFSLVGSCNGLLCILKLSHLILLNPSTRMFQAIRIFDEIANPTDFGFAFDHENLEFKIVVVFDQYSSRTSKTRLTRVYSLNTNSWRDAGATPRFDSIGGQQNGALINDHLLHWMFWDKSLRKCRICCFDVCTENWKDDVLFPAYYYDPTHKNYLLEFGVFDGCLFSSFENRVDSCFDVWVMKEYGVQDSWTRLLSIPVSDDLKGGVVPIVCRQGSADILIRQCRKPRLFWYNSTVDNKGIITEAAFHQAPDFSKLKPYTCIRSRVTLPHGARFEELSG